MLPVRSYSAYPRLDIRIFTVCSVLVLCLGCGSSYYVQRIEDGERSGDLIDKLGEFPTDERARNLLIRLLRDDDARPGVHCVAVIALGRHIRHGGFPQSWKAMYLALTEVLDDARVSCFMKPGGGVLSYFMPIDLLVRTGSARAESLRILTETLEVDFGFNREDWVRHINERWPPEKAPARREVRKPENVSG